MDIFSLALRDFLDGVRNVPFRIHRDDGWIVEDSAASYFETDPWPHEAPALAHATGHVLDIGCGAGRHLLWFGKQGMDATGLDASPIAVETCNLRGCTSVFEFDIMSGARPPALPPIDTITLLGNNVGIGGTFEGACRLFRNLAAMGQAHSRLIVTGIDIRATTNPAHRAYHASNIEAGRRRGEISMRFEYKGQTGPWIPWYHPEPCEIDEIAAASGWTISEVDVLGSGFFWAVLTRQN